MLSLLQSLGLKYEARMAVADIFLVFRYTFFSAIGPSCSGLIMSESPAALAR